MQYICSEKPMRCLDKVTALHPFTHRIVFAHAPHCVFSFTAHCSPLTAHRSPLTTHRSPLIAHLSSACHHPICQNFSNVRAFSMSVSMPFAWSALSRAQWLWGSMPNSVCCLCASMVGQALKRTAHPQGSSLVKGSPPPPPVRSPSTVTLSRHFMLRTKTFAEL